MKALKDYCHKFNLLIIDDEECILELLEDHFSQYEFNVFAASTVTEAMKVCKETKIDVVLSDLRLGDVCGQTLIERLKKELDFCGSVFFMSGCGSDKEANIMGNALFEKPFCMEGIVQNVLKSLIKPI